MRGAFKTSLVEKIATNFWWQYQHDIYIYCVFGSVCQDFSKRFKCFILCSSIISWTGYRLNRLSLRNNRWKFETSGILPIALEESIEDTSTERKYQNRKMSTCNRLDLESLGSWPTTMSKTYRALVGVIPFVFIDELFSQNPVRKWNTLSEYESGLSHHVGLMCDGERLSAQLEQIGMVLGFLIKGLSIYILVGRAVRWLDFGHRGMPHRPADCHWKLPKGSRAACCWWNLKQLGLPCKQKMSS